MVQRWALLASALVLGVVLIAAYSVAERDATDVWAALTTLRQSPAGASANTLSLRSGSAAKLEAENKQLQQDLLQAEKREADLEHQLKEALAQVQARGQAGTAQSALTTATVAPQATPAPAPALAHVKAPLAPEVAASAPAAPASDTSRGGGDGGGTASFSTSWASDANLPLAPKELQSADWLLNEDRLVTAPAAGEPDSRILLCEVVFVDNKRSGWGKEKGKKSTAIVRPRWLRASLAANRLRARKFGHTMIIRWKPSLETPERWARECGQDLSCLVKWERENFNWEKEKMMVQYLQSPKNFTHVFILDADAAIVHTEHDTLRLMAGELVSTGKELLTADEDWQANGKGRINGGLLFAANTAWNRNFFQDIMDAHMLGGITKPRIGGSRITCNSNEQLCINGMKARKQFADMVLVTSGMKYNRGGCVLGNCFRGGGASNTEMGRLRLRDPELELIHFMGGSKGYAEKALCDEGLDVAITGEGPEGYGCAP